MIIQHNIYLIEGPSMRVSNTIDFSYPDDVKAQMIIDSR